MTGSRRARWRERWARQETERRATAYEASLARWQQRDAELAVQLAAATTTQSLAEGDWSGWLDVAPDEVVYWVGSDAGLIEAPYALRLRPPHYRELGRTDEPAADPPIDIGQVAITDRRVIFHGRARREWAFSTLIGMAHTAGGETWLLVTSGTAISGVAPPRAAVTEFRVQLALALADEAGERDAFVAELAAQVEAHQEAKPQPPPPITGDLAPPSAWWGRHGRLAGAAAASVVLLSLFAIGTALAGNDQPPESFSPSAESPGPPPSAAPDSPPATAAGGEPNHPAVQPRPEPLASGCTAYAGSAGWCVGGAGDYDCAGGSGDGPNYAPRDVTVAVPGIDPFGLDEDGNGVGCEGPPPTPPPSSAPPTSPPEDTLDPWFPNCDEANEAGFGPYHRDEDPEYWWYRDRNGDGVVCRP